MQIEGSLQWRPILFLHNTATLARCPSSIRADVPLQALDHYSVGFFSRGVNISQAPTKKCFQLQTKICQQPPKVLSKACPNASLTTTWLPLDVTPAICPYDYIQNSRSRLGAREGGTVRVVARRSLHPVKKIFWVVISSSFPVLKFPPAIFE